ncbi:RHS repeat-associated core domain-containing protein [Rheinheimera sp. MMS21-TC3]|uniref:RHS repeat-associated core domain-containing protein n=1 Tax=Rheinheimera sp. MMS21-TC3 TaxID=3072790 RepID=UPI0028C497E2|nr:RHS repeat-associated core domain-containing protein [Rheinheimera sp. MMS21-TC3]WNO61007.1 RHS repeat-associated core domain-containing protein [Rheinheimera sp. MMS21-TC3]
MSVQSVQLQNQNGTVFQLSTQAEPNAGEAKSFPSAADAAGFLQQQFQFNLQTPLNAILDYLGVPTLHSGGSIEATKQAYKAIASAVMARKVFIYEIAPKPVALPESQTMGPAPTTKAKAANQGGRTDNSETTNEDATAVSDQAGSNAAGTAITENAKVETCGDPVAMATGEEILELTDFSLPGPVPLNFIRTYRSSQSHENIGMGFGWRSNFHVKIVAIQSKDEPEQNGLYLHNEEGRRLHFAIPKLGQTSYQLSEDLALRYEKNGSLVLLKPDNSQWVFVPSAKEQQQWQLHQILDSLGHFLQCYYDKQNRLSRIDYTRKRGIELHYNSQGLLQRIDAVEQGEHGLVPIQQQLAAYEYDTELDLTRAINIAGQVEHYQYQQHLITERQRASGFKHYFAWQGQGPAAKCIRNWGDDGYYDYHFQYDEQRNTTTSTDSRGQCWQYVHNARNQLVKKMGPDGATWLYSWNSAGKKVSETEPNGAVNRFYYNELGQLKTVEQGDGAISHFSYNDLGQRCGFIDAEGHHWQREYTSGGLLKAEIRPDGSSTRYEYNLDGQLTKKINPDGQSTLYHHNDEGQLLAVKQHHAVERYSYDKLGRLNGISDAAGLITEFKRNNAGQIIQQRQYSSAQPEQVSCIDYQYDIAGRLISQQNPLQHKIQWRYEGLSQPVTMLQADGSALNYEYDKERNLTAIMRSDGARYAIDYDGQERPVALTGFDGRAQHFQYDASGKVSQATDADQRKIKLKRDQRGRIIEQVAQHQQQIHNNHFHYNKLGRLLRASNGQRKLRFNYNGNGQITEQWQDDWRSCYQYDSSGRITALTLADGNTLNYAYTPQGQLESLTLNQQPLFTCQYDNAGREISRQYQNGLVLNQQYDAFNRLTQQQWQPEPTKDASQNTRQREYQYSALHQVIAIKDNQEGEISYGYNALDQLTSKQHNQDSSQNEQHQWDSFGNPQGDDVEVKQDRLLRYQQNQYQYDASGNQTSFSTSGKRQQREFNGFNQLTSLFNSENGHDSVTRYEYDALGRRSAKITAQGRTDYLWQDNTLLGEHQNGEFTWYLFEPNSNKPLALIKRGKVYFYQLDQLGTPLSLTDSDNNIVWQAHYTVFGKATLTVNKIDNPIRFQGQYYDSESGLHYNHFRYYDPQTGRFISQDPIGLLGGINHYQYAPNHINWIDPLGLCAKESGVDFYVGPSGPLATLPSTAYRYDRYLNDDGTLNEWGDKIIQSGEGRVTYFGFEKYDSGTKAADAFQIKTKRHVNPLDPEDRSWSDSRLRSEFDTLQLFDKGGVPSVRVPTAYGDKPGEAPEPFTSAYPEFGAGGAQQLHADGAIIKYRNTEVLPED